MERVVVTGIGCVTPIGIGFDAFAEGLRFGKSGVRELSAFDSSPFRCKVAAEIVGFEPRQFMEAREARSLPKVVQYAVAAAKLAREHSGLTHWPDPRRVGVLFGTSSGSLGYALEQHAVFLERGARRMHPSSPAFGHNSVISSECAIQLGVHGVALVLSSACTSSTDAIGVGARLLTSGIVDVLLVGGAEAPLVASLFASFDRLGMLATRHNANPSAACRPFDADRDGLVLGEGAAVLVLERENDARTRGAALLAEIAGYGATCDAWSHFHQEPSGDDARRAIEGALSEGRVEPGAVDYVNAHGTATRENDPFETAVLKEVFGEHADAIPVSSTKSQIGHLLGASGAVEAAAIIAGMTSGFIPATLNLETPDPHCQLRHVMGRSRAASINVAISTNFGFGARNAALLLRRCENVGRVG